MLARRSICLHYTSPPLFRSIIYVFCIFFFFNDTATTEIYTLSLHDALPIYICTKDILDALAYQIQIARPGEIEEVIDRTKTRDFVAVGKADEFLKWAWGSANQKDQFGNPAGVIDPYKEEPDEMLVDATNPFSDDYFENDGL